MLSARVKRESSRRLINQARFADVHDHAGLMKSATSNLGKAPYYAIVRDILEEAYEKADGYLARFNIGIIERVADSCGITTQRICSSELRTSHPQTDKTDRLLKLCDRVSARTYLSPPGSLDYLQVRNPFAGSDVNLVFHQYEHPIHPQAFGTFLPYMAIIDALAWVGPAELLPLIQSGARPPLSIEEMLNKPNTQLPVTVATHGFSPETETTFQRGLSQVQRTDR
jgi:hypothetical protein